MMDVNILQQAAEIFKLRDIKISQQAKLMEQPEGFCEVFSVDNAFKIRLDFPLIFPIDEYGAHLVYMVFDCPDDRIGQKVIFF